MKRLAELETKDKEREAREKAREERLTKLEQFIPPATMSGVTTGANIKAD